MIRRHSIACIGAAHIDRKGLAIGPVVFGSSNPVRMRRALGGVARNVADGLARLGVDVALLSRVGCDADGDTVIARLAAQGIDVSLVTRSSTSPTGSYTALLGPNGRLEVALADMDIYDEVVPDLVEDAMPALRSRALWFIDANFPRVTFAHLLARKPVGTRAVVDTVSVSKVERLCGLLDRVDVLFANQAEAAHLTGIDIAGCGDAERAARRLIGMGAGTAVVALGVEGVVAVDSGGAICLPAPFARVRDVTGAGDALITGTLAGLIDDRALRDSLSLGQACASIVLESEETVPATLCLAAALTRAGLAML